MDKGMICVTEIKVIKVPNYQVHLQKIQYAMVENSDPPEYVKVTDELVTGRKFVNINGSVVNIGMSQQVQDAIGLPFMVFDNLQKEVNALNSNMQRLSLECEGYRLVAEGFRNAKFFSRLKYLFTGKV